MVGDHPLAAGGGVGARAARVRLACLDLDGTLVDPDKLISPVNRAAVARARAAGIEIAVASGRHPFNIAEVMDDLGLAHTAVCLSGAFVMHEGREVFRHPLGLERVEAAIDVAEGLGCYVSVAGADFNLTAGDIRRPKGDAAGARRYVSCDGYDDLRHRVRSRGDELLKSSLHAEGEEEYRRLRESLLHLEGVTLAQSDVRWVDVTAEGCSKAEGISALAGALGLGLSEVCAVGDDENDVESISAVGLGVAMGNAIAPVRDAAALVVADNRHDGVAEALDLIVSSRTGGARP